MTLTTCAGANAAAVAKAEAKITDFMATGWFWVGLGRAGRVAAACRYVTFWICFKQAA
jgi:hypothetical protein